MSLQIKNNERGLTGQGLAYSNQTLSMSLKVKNKNASQPT